MRSTAPKMTDGTEKGEKGDRDALGDPAGEVDRCPICLTPPGPRDRAIPESCDHLFCLRCILTWGQTVPSCPVDRRPFSVVYKLDAVLGTVKIPVKQKTNWAELQMCCYGKEREETKSCTSRRRPGEKTPHGILHTKMKEDFVRKCKSHDSKCNQEASGLRKKKLMDLCGAWFLGPNITSLHPESGSSAALTQCYAELFREDDGDSTILQKRCRLDLQNWTWLHATAAIPVSGLSRLARQGCSPCEMSISALPLRSPSSRSTSATGQQAGHFVFQVEECIITCARGGEKKASKPSSSKGSKNQTETSTTRRSNRHSKAEESPPALAPTSSPSHHSGSDSPVLNLSAMQGGAPKPEQKPVGKRSSKQKAKQKSGVRRRQRRKASQESHSSPEESGLEELNEEEEHKETDEGSRSHIPRCQNANAKTSTSKQLTDQEGIVISSDNNLQQEVPHLIYTNINLQQEVSCPITTDHNSQEEVSCPSTPGNDSQQEVSCPTTPNDDLQQEIKSPITTDESSQQEDEEAKNLVGLGNESNRENDSGGRKTVSESNDISPSSTRQEQVEMKDYLKKHSQEEVHKAPEVFPNMEHTSTQEGAEVLSLGEVEGSISSGQKEAEPERPLENTMFSGCDQPMEEEMDLMEAVIDKENSEDEAPANIDELSQDSEPSAFSDHSNGDLLGNREPKPSDQPNGNIFDRCSDGLTEPERPREEVSLHLAEFGCTQEAKNEESLSEDNTDLVPMECDSPGSEDREPQSEQEGESSACVPKAKAPGAKNRSEQASSHEASQGKKEPRQRRSRFHSPSITWSPKGDSKIEQQEGEQREGEQQEGEQREGEQREGEQREGEQREREQREGEQREREQREGEQREREQREGEQREGEQREREQREGDRRSRSKDRNTTLPSRRRSRTCSRDRDRGRDNSRSEGSRRNRSRERRSKRRSRSRSRSRNRTFGGRGSSSECGESRRQSPRRRERWANDSWKNSWGNDQPRREDQDKPSGLFGKEADDSDKGGLAERLAEKARGQNPDAVREKGDSGSGVVGASRWEDNCSDSVGDSWAQIVGRGSWNSEDGRGVGRTRGGSREEPSQNRWQSRNSFSGTQNSSANDSYGRSGESQSDRRRGEVELSEAPFDRSGWSSASSRAIRRTLPADVQSYYSRRGRNSAGSGCGWNRQEEETPVQDLPHNEAYAVPRGEGPQLPLTVPTQPLAVTQFPMGAHAAPMSLPPPPFGIPSQVPVPIHSAMPLFQGLPPPPPPPPPLQQADGRPPRAVSSIPVQGGTRFYAPVLPGHPKAPGDIGQPSVLLPSSTTQPTSKDFSKIEACADSSKKEKKLQIQERAVQEVKTAIKPYYQNKDITKDEYKEIVRKAVEKVCHSKSGEVNSGKVANLVKAYVDKYKHARKNKSDVHSKC